MVGAISPSPKKMKRAEILQGIALGPAEIGVRRLADTIADREQDGGDGVRNGGSLGPEHAEPPDLLANHATGAANSEASRTVTSRKSTDRQWGCGWPRAPPLLQQVLARVPLVGVVGDEAHRAAAAGLVIQRSAVSSKLDGGGAQLGRAHGPGDERDDDDRDDEEAGDLDAVRPLDDVGDGRVDEDQRDRRRRPTSATRCPRSRRRQGHGDRGRGDQHQHAGGVGAALGVDVGVEDHGDHEGDRGEDEHQRPGGARPVGGHAVAGQVAGHEVEQPGHRRGAGEPEDARWW